MKNKIKKKDYQLYYKANAIAYNENSKAFNRFYEAKWQEVLKQNPVAKKEDYIYKGNILGFEKEEAQEKPIEKEKIKCICNREFEKEGWKKNKTIYVHLKWCPLKAIIL